MLLVEKAYAKLQGSYYNCRLGDPGDGLLDLTGAPCVGYDLRNPALTFEDLWCWDCNDALICASTPGTDTFTEGGGARGGGATGLVPGHAYTVVQCRRLRKNGRYKGSSVRARHPPATRLPDAVRTRARARLLPATLPRLAGGMFGAESTNKRGHISTVVPLSLCHRPSNPARPCFNAPCALLTTAVPHTVAAHT